MMIIAVGYSTYHLWSRKGSHFNEKFAMLYIGLFIAALVGNIIHTLRGGPIGECFLSFPQTVRSFQQWTLCLPQRATEHFSIVELPHRENIPISIQKV